MGNIACKYEGHNIGRRSRDAQILFARTIEEAKKDEFFDNRAKGETFYGAAGSRNGVGLIAYIGKDSKLHLSCSNARCPKRALLGKCTAERAMGLPANLQPEE